MSVPSGSGAGAGAARIAAVLPARGAEDVAAALRELDPSCLFLDPGTDVVSGAGAAGATVLLVHEAALGTEGARGIETPEGSTDRPAHIVLLLDPARPGSLSGRTAGFSLHVALPVSPPALAALVRGLDPQRAAGPIRARGPGDGGSEALYRSARDAVGEVLAAAGRGVPPSLDATRLHAERVHTDLLRSNALVLRSLEPHPAFDLASHSVNVAVIAGKIAMGLAHPAETIVRVVHAGLVHDLGMARLPGRLLSNAGTWSDEDRAELRRHPALGAELLEAHVPSYEWLQRVVLQEHERRQGQGYPNGLAGPAIDPIARIVAVADVFEALSHPRTYRSPNTALEALEQVAGMGGEWFDPGVVAALVNEISAFPLDSYVQLSTGEIARVTGTNPDNLFRPRVEIVWDAEWARVEPPRALDLADTPGITVARSLFEGELPID